MILASGLELGRNPDVFGKEEIDFHDENCEVWKVVDLTDFLYFFTQMHFLCLGLLYVNIALQIPVQSSLDILAVVL